MVYSDTRAWGPVEEPLYDPILGLAGKPDYLIDKGGMLIPVEVKSSRHPETPYDSHIYQLAAYCLLVQNVHGKRPPYGILHYSSGSNNGRTYAIDYTSELESAVRGVLSEMRSQERRREVHRSHEQPARCKGCGYHSTCEESLG